MDIFLIAILVICVAAAIAVMLSARKKGRCSSCPYNDNCSRKDWYTKGDD